MIEKHSGFEKQAEILKALGHPVRLQIMHVLMEKHWCVCELAEELDVRQPYLSQQLAYLRRAGDCQLYEGRFKGAVRC
ncbi:MAG: hypothetical protein A2Z14_02360 [Chloroflexi bacterium RBG_16_48_8]|nr:MAG: hypothetical protein A2Z14_02360 [Chloroflexi bacterium RBG_16_48_8]